MAFLRSRTGVSLRADLSSTTSDFSLSLREEFPLPVPMTSFISRLFCERVNRSVGFSARGSKGQVPLSGAAVRGLAGAATAAGDATAAGEAAVTGVATVLMA